MNNSQQFGNNIFSIKTIEADSITTNVINTETLTITDATLDIPSMTQIEINALDILTLNEGSIIFNSTTKSLMYFNGVLITNVTMNSIVDWQESVKDKDILTPPGFPSNNDRYIINGVGTNAWLGQDNNIAQWSVNLNAWVFTNVSLGMICYVEDEQILYVYNPIWSLLSAGNNTHNLLLTLQGGTFGEFFHLTNLEHAKVVNMDQNVSSVSNVSFNTVNGRDVGVDGTVLDNLNTTLGLGSLTTNEVTQITNIGTTIINPTQFSYLGSFDQSLSTIDNVTFNQVTGTIITPTQPNITSVGILNGLDVSGSGVQVDSILEHTLNNGVSIDGISVKDGVITGDLAINTLPGSTYTTLVDEMNISSSTGLLGGGGVISNTGTGNVNITGGVCRIRATSNPLSTLYFCDFQPLNNQVVTDDSLSHVYVEYNAGVPQLIITLTKRTEEESNIYVGSLYREGVSLHIHNNNGHVINDLAKKISHRFMDTNPYVRASGAILSIVGALGFSVTGGEWYHGLNEYLTPQFNSSSGFDYYWRDGLGSWTEIQNATVIDYVHWDDGSGTLQVLNSDSDRSVHWIYQSSDGGISIIYGEDEYSSSGSKNAQPPGSIPENISVDSRLIGKAICKKEDQDIKSLENVFGVSYTLSQVDGHNETANIQGGLADQYYHLNLVEYTNLNGIDQSVSSTSAVSHLSVSTDIITEKTLNSGTNVNGVSLKLNDIQLVDTAIVGWNNNVFLSVAGNSLSGLIYNVPTSLSHDFRINNISAMVLDNVQLNIGNKNIIGVNDLTVNGQILGATDIEIRDNVVFDGSEGLKWAGTLNTLTGSITGIDLSVESGDTINLKVNGLDQISVSETEIDFKNNNVVNIGDLVQSNVQAPSLTDLSLSTDLGQLVKVKVNALDQMTISETIIDMKSNNLVGVNDMTINGQILGLTDIEVRENIIFDGTEGLKWSGTLNTLTGSTVGINMSVELGDVYNFQVNNLDQLTISETELNCRSNSLVEVPIVSSLSNLSLSVPINQSISMNVNNVDQLTISETTIDMKSNNVIGINDMTVNGQIFGATDIAVRENIIFDGSEGLKWTGTLNTITGSLGGINIGVDVGDVISLAVNSLDQITISETTVDMNSNDLVGVNNLTVNGQITGATDISVRENLVFDQTEGIKWASTLNSITGSLSGIDIGVDIGDTIVHSVNSLSQLSVSETQIDMHGNNVVGVNDIVINGQITGATDIECRENLIFDIDQGIKWAGSTNSVTGSTTAIALSATVSSNILLRVNGLDMIDISNTRVAIHSSALVNTNHGLDNESPDPTTSPACSISGLTRLDNVAGLNTVTLPNGVAMGNLKYFNLNVTVFTSCDISYTGVGGGTIVDTYSVGNYFIIMIWVGDGWIRQTGV